MGRLMNLAAAVVSAGLVLPAAAGGQSRDVFRDCPECPEMIVVPSGSFRMGSDESDTSSPVRDVEVATFALGRTEVKRSEYSAFVNATGRPTYFDCAGAQPSHEVIDYGPDVERSWRAPGYEQDEDHPVTCVSWADASAYVAWLSGITGRKYRLPSEAEWEYAARAGTEARHYWGDVWRCGYGNFVDLSWHGDIATESLPDDCDDGARFTASVGRFRPNAFGLHDMLGNLWEWTADCWHDNYGGAPLDGNPWARGECNRHAVRGWSWDNRVSDIRVYYRHVAFTGYIVSSYGFRVARTIE